MMSVAVSRPHDGLKDLHGRGMNIRSDVYKLPVDEEEHNRLTIQHRIWKLMLGGSTGLYPPDVEPIVKQLLKPTTGSADSPSVLDLGSGSGIWAAEMAAMHPNVTVVGIDLAEPKLLTIPKNCRFLIADFTKDLEEFAETFDIVHCRCVAGHVIDRTGLLRQIAKLLKPGGLLLLGDGNLQIFSSDRTVVSPASSLDFIGVADKPEPASRDPIYIALWLEQVIKYMLTNTLDPDHAGGGFLDTLVTSEPALEYFGGRAYYSPIRPEGENSGSPSRIAQELSALTERNMLNFLAASRPILLSRGLPHETVDEWQARARKDILEPGVYWSMRWNLVWALKRRIEA
ncbi:S-adenosyl-L-methionine-dependent methyltransferase [Pyrrhoderma noxium]|uniref:S-adenosyl-L-methionine-dependent methyltransferase n=1 Tax=Pyrrhoderma noxium TaxID=2282107 RepID=A0A286U713_9AGAM|nr:S-adenosyl-L-methionine-dependent methyltransferase [Pyrrhoderma noxium]